MDFKPKYLKNRLLFKRFYLIILFLLLIFLYNFTNLWGTNWFIHPDDHATWVFSKHLSETGTFYITNPLNMDFDRFVVSPAASIYVNGRFIPVKSVGEYYLFALLHPLDGLLTFYLVPLLGLIGTYFFMLLVKELHGLKTALLSVFLFAYSFPIIYWSNMLYSNIPSLTFFIMGLYFLSKIEKSNFKQSYYLLAFLFLSTSSWLRYEYLVFTLIVITIVSKKIFRGNNFKKIFMMVFILLFTISPIFLSNFENFGSPLTLGYTSNVEVSNKSANDMSFQESIFTGFEKLYNRFFVYKKYLNISRISKNVKDWIFDINLDLMPLVVVGLLYSIFNSKNREFLLSFIVLAFLWSWETSAGYHWGEDTNWLGTTYIRYLLIVYAIFSIYASVAIVNVVKKSNKKFIILFIAMLLVTHITLTTDMLFNGNVGLRETTNMKEKYYEINSVVNTYPTNSIFVTNIADKYMLNVNVFSTRQIPGDKQYKQNVTVEYMTSFLQQGYHIYLVEISTHAETYLELDKYIENNHRLKVTKVEDSPTIFEVKLIDSKF